MPIYAVLLSRKNCGGLGSEVGSIATHLSLPQLRCIDVERRGWVGVSQQRLKRQQYRRHRVGRAPLVLQDVQADVAVYVHIGMPDLRSARGEEMQGSEAVELTHFTPPLC